jgi:hypothetical protein
MLFSSGTGYLVFNGWLPDDDIRLAVLANEDTADLDHVLTEMLHAAFSGWQSAEGRCH